MIPSDDNNSWRMGLLAVLLGAFGTAPAVAEELRFRNESCAPVIVQAACVSRGVFLRGRPYLLRPGEESPAIVLPGEKVITIYDAKVPNRVLFQKSLPLGSLDLRFRILADVPAPRVRIETRPSSKP